MSLYVSVKPLHLLSCVLDTRSIRSPFKLDANIVSSFVLLLADLRFPPRLQHPFRWQFSRLSLREYHPVACDYISLIFILAVERHLTECLLGTRNTRIASQDGE